MVFLTLTDFHANSSQAVYSAQPEPLPEADCLIANWQEEDMLPELLRAAETGTRLIVPELWQNVFPQAELIVPSSISGGDLRQRFRQLAHRRCWLLLDPMRAVFPLPCPDGQGTPVRDVPEQEGFFSEALCCRYIHSPSHVTLFDTAETLEKKLLLAQECGFLGFFQIPETSP